MSNKKIYKGLNKRKKFDFRKFITTMLCITLIVGYAYKKIKLDEVFKSTDVSSNFYLIIDKLYFWKDKGLDIFNIKSKDVNSDNLINKTENKSENNEKSATNTQVAIVQGIDVYLIQVGSFDDDKKLNEIKLKLQENNIPSSTLEIENINKEQAYISFKEEDIRNKLEITKKIFEDAFVTKLEIPVLSLEYTQDYNYIKEISNNLNSLLKNYKEESDYLNQNKDNLDYEKYKSILNERKNIVQNLEKEVKKIDYDELDVFKTNLLSYSSQITDNISNYGEVINAENICKYESLLISSIQMYYEFINKIKIA